MDSIGNSYRDTLRSHDHWKSLNKLKQYGNRVRNHNKHLIH